MPKLVKNKRIHFRVDDILFEKMQNYLKEHPTMSQPDMIRASLEKFLKEEE